MAQIYVRLEGGVTAAVYYFLDNRKGKIKLRSIHVPSLVVVKNRIIGDNTEELL